MAGKKKKQRQQTSQPSLKLSEQQQKPGLSKQERQTKKQNKNETIAQEPGGVLVTPKPKKPNVTELWADYFQKGELSDWQRLCEDLGLPSDLPSKKQCRNALKRVNVNIHQFLGASVRPEQVKFFHSVQDLENYTRKHHLFYPKKKIPKGSPLCALLKFLI